MKKIVEPLVARDEFNLKRKLQRLHQLGVL